jgi:uncharacterized protein (TIGR03435 family)
VDAGRVNFECSNLINLMAYAFRISPARIVGPDWMSSLDAPRFDVAAKLPDGGSERQAPEMLQALLAERFKLITHRGTRTQTLYALAVAKGGLKTMETGDPESDVVERKPDENRTQHWEASSITLAGLADWLDGALPLDSPVLDMTGMKGRYRLVLEVTLSDLPGFGAPLEMENALLARFNEGLRKLGLDLDRRKGPVGTVVIDHVERMPAGN